MFTLARAARPRRRETCGSSDRARDVVARSGVGIYRNGGSSTAASCPATCGRSAVSAASRAYIARGAAIANQNAQPRSVQPAASPSPRFGVMQSRARTPAASALTGIGRRSRDGAAVAVAARGRASAQASSDRGAEAHSRKTSAREACGWPPVVRRNGRARAAPARAAGRGMRTPALDTWRAELAAGQRTPYDFDPLFRAACREADALGFQSIPQLAEACLRDARKIIAAAAREQQRGSA